jgi:hypothetical protein
MKQENNNMIHKNCEQTELLVDDYLEGMISTEDRSKMEEHLAGCPACRKYLEETVILIEKAALLSRDEALGKEMLPTAKQAELWNRIEAKINESLPDARSTHIYNMSGYDDVYSSADKPSVVKLEPKTSRWGAMRYYVSGLAAVFILAFVIYGVNQFLKRNNDINLTNGIVEVSGGPKWMVTSIKGSPLINNMVMKAIDSLGIGGYVTTDDSSKAELYVAGLGSVIIEPNTKVKLVKSTEGEHRIQLDYGSIDANILAKPRTFFVDAGSVTAVDLGCSYKFSVDKAGDGLLYVRSGMVALESASGRESIVPEGKFCVTRQDIGPGTPFREDSSPKLKKALMEFDFGTCGGECVRTILSSAKKTDAVTLVNILPRVDQQYKTEVYNRVAYFYAPPKNIPSDSIPKLKRLENVNEWVDKIMKEVQKNIEENMQRVEQHIKKFDEEKFQKQWEHNWEKNVKKNWNFNYNYNYGPGLDTMIWHDGTGSLSQEELDELNREMEELQNDLKIDNEEFKQEMEKMKEELKKVNEKIRQEMEEVQKEIEKDKLEYEKDRKKYKKEQKKKFDDTGDDDDKDD